MDKYLSRSVSSSSLNSKRDREDETSEDWQQPKRTAIQKPTFNKPVFATSNRYSDLAVDQGSQISEPLRSAIVTRKNPNRIPPIIVLLQEDWTHDKIQKVVVKYTNNFHIQYRGKNKVALQCYSSDTHQIIKEALRNENARFHTYTRKDEKMFKVVIRGLPAYFEDTLQGELDKIGFKDASVTKLSSPSKQTASCPPFLVQLPAGTDILKFRQIKYIGNCVVDIRKFKPNPSTGTQCFRCQGFGHSSRNCNLPARCVKCTEPHASQECPKKDRSLPARCCNCLEDHPANFSKCTERQKYLNRLKEKIDPRIKINVQETKPDRFNHNGKPQEVNPQPKTWASLVSSQQVKPPPPENAKSPDSDNTTKEMLQILAIIKNLRGQFVECKSMLDKVVLILTHLGQYV